MPLIYAERMLAIAEAESLFIPLRHVQKSSSPHPPRKEKQYILNPSYDDLLKTSDSTCRGKQLQRHEAFNYNDMKH